MFFNQQKLDDFLDLLDDEIIHHINQGDIQKGKAAFREFMFRMNQCYQETIEDIVIMTSEYDPHRAASEFTVIGTYLSTDSGLPVANNQKYKLTGGAFFEIKNNKIIRVTNYYNMNEWLKQIKE